MRRIIVSVNITLDGFIADADGGLEWQFGTWTNDMAEAMAAQLSNADTILLGKNTYSAMAGYWPVINNSIALSRDDMAFAGMMNSYEKVVCSSTLTNTSWNNSTFINGDVNEAIQSLKQQTGKDIMVYGSGMLANWLLQHNLADELQLWICPVALGRGTCLFKSQLHMQLKKMRQFSSGVVMLYYYLNYMA